MLQTYATSKVVHSISIASIFELCPLELCKYQFLSKIKSALQLIPDNTMFFVQFN